jgi:hypothetical protein
MVVVLCFGLLGQAWQAPAHYQATVVVQRILAELGTNTAHLAALPRGTSELGYMAYEVVRHETAWSWFGSGPSPRAGPLRDHADLRYYPMADPLALQAALTDYYKDLELVDVEGWVGTGRDDPHRDEWDAVDDVPHYSARGKVFTAF